MKVEMARRGVRRGIKFAVRAALLSTAKQRVGAALICGKTLVSIGWNSSKTHPCSCSPGKSMHAEFACLIGCNREQLSSSTLFVVRLTKGGNLGISKPCRDCHELIMAIGIRRVFYLNRKGEIEKL